MSKVLRNIKAAPSQKVETTNDLPDIHEPSGVLEDSRRRKTDKETKAKKVNKPKRERGRFGCVAGTRKEQVAAELEKNGREAAMKKAAALGIKESSAKGWIGFWKRNGHWTPVANEAKPSRKTKKSA